MEFIIVGLFITFLIGGAVWGYLQWNTNLTPLKAYKGEFKEVLVKATDYLIKMGSIKTFDVTIASPKDKRISELTYNWLGVPQILLNENDIHQESWRKDFNLMADIVGVPHLENDSDLAVFFLFHEFRHAMQDKKLAQMEVMDANDERVKKGVTAYHQQPREWDADIFALKTVAAFKQA